MLFIFDNVYSYAIAFWTEKCNKCSYNKINDNLIPFIKQDGYNIERRINSFCKA